MKTTQDPYECGPAAAGRLAEYDADISANFELGKHVGKLIAAWDRPKFVSAAEAGHMREDDYVVGFKYKQHTRAYPLWITDNYHIINDRIAGESVLFTTCERCQSGSAFVPEVAGQPAAFSALGMHNASLTMVNRKRGDVKKHSLWLHYEGVAIDGPEKGNFLRQLPTYHMTWEEWLMAHPETDVMLPPEDPHHRDARHGHGREEYFSRPGMDPPLASTITGQFDHRYPENEIVLGINIDAGVKAYPLLEAKREGGVINDDIGGLPVAVFCGPRPEQVTMSAFSREIAGRVVTFERCGDQFRDCETASLWTIEGKAVAGPLNGQRLQALRWQYVRWHAWVYPHPTTELFRSLRPLPSYPDFPACVQVEAVRDVLSGLSVVESDLRLSHVIPGLCLPQEARHGVCVYSGNDRLNVFAFHSVASARDYAEMQGAWFCWPFDMKLARKRVKSVGRFVVESDPERQYAEPTQTVRYPDNETQWSELVNNPELIGIWTSEIDHGSGARPRFMELIDHLKQKRYDVVEVAFLPRSQLRVGTLSAIAATVEGDRFAIYRCTSEEAAAEVALEVTHAIHIGPWVLRSIPILMYAEPRYEMGQLPDEEIKWSPLLGSTEFMTDLSEFVHGK